MKSSKLLLLHPISPGANAVDMFGRLVEMYVALYIECKFQLRCWIAAWSVYFVYIKSVYMFLYISYRKEHSLEEIRGGKEENDTNSSL